jgi:putative selenate reductase
MSAGYDREGIRSPRMEAFLRGLLDARSAVEALRRRIPDRWRSLRAVPFTTRIASSVTVSTFHGCPVSEIERICRFLMEDLGLDCTIKLNPTLLGARELHEILHERLGWTHLTVPPGAFENDPEWDEAAEIVTRLRDRARELGRGFAVKLTNTLIVENASDFLPRTESLAYLSGGPLHVMAMHLVARFRRELGPSLPISFSAGIDRMNFPEAVRLGLAPVTVCTDLLRQGGYARLPGYAAELSDRMDAAHARDLPEFVTGDVDAYLEKLDDDPRYRFHPVTRRMRSGHAVTPTECAMCDLCITVCPNDAMFRAGAPYGIACLDDLCNDCGNCETFCPDGGKPQRDKLRVELADAGGWRLAVGGGTSKEPPVSFLNCLEDR